MNRDGQRVSALAAILQPVALVHGIARTGRCDPAPLTHTLATLFAKGDNALALYGNSSRHLDEGLKMIERLFDGNISHDDAKPMLTYSATLINLEKQLRHQDEMLATIASGLERIQKQVDYFEDVTHNSVVASIAELYGNTISQLKPRVVVRGRSEYMRQSANTNRVRALLLAALRAVHCWHRAGGNHLRLLLGRRALLNGARKMRSYGI
ncbi:MAG: DUF489 family protein [Mariprofundales bacterium]|nr:DUF489 family protein [Mariprofundales bacterium]